MKLWEVRLPIYRAYQIDTALIGLLPVSSLSVHDTGQLKLLEKF
jgi:hypothetical protein